MVVLSTSGILLLLLFWWGKWGRHLFGKSQWSYGMYLEPRNGCYVFKTIEKQFCHCWCFKQRKGNDKLSIINPNMADRNSLAKSVILHSQEYFAFVMMNNSRQQ